jgi:hypothetical protein
LFLNFGFSDPSTLTKKKQSILINDHKFKFYQSFSDDNPDLTAPILHRGGDLFAQKASQLIQEIISKPISKDEIENFIDDWSRFIQNL